MIIRYALLFFLVTTSNSFAESFKVMSFNTMCDLCGSESYDTFEKRIKYIQTTIKEHSPDLVSLQELRLASHAKGLFNKNFRIITTANSFISYADPLLAINSLKFEILEKGHFWLGPSESFSLGWKYALPRQVHWVRLGIRTSNQQILFIGSHFDNRVENMLGSAKKVNDFIKQFNIPIIFAADTNITTDFEAYPILVGDELTNSFDIKKILTVYANKKVIKQYQDKELCYHRKGDEFPACRVDHILLSKKHPWKINKWSIDISKFGEKKSFASDHRAIITELEI